MNINLPVSRIMSTDLKTVKILNLMTDVAELFDSSDIHHLPVISEEGLPLGMISRHDYNQLQHQFTRQGWELAEAANNQLFRSLTVREVMTSNPVTLDKDEPIERVLNIFLSNRLHSVIITEEGLCSGIVTPYDIIKEVKKLNNVLK